MPWLFISIQSPFRTVSLVAIWMPATNPMIASLNTKRKPMNIAPNPAINAPTSRPMTMEITNTPPIKQATSITAWVKPLIGMRLDMSNRW